MDTGTLEFMLFNVLRLLVTLQRAGSSEFGECESSEESSTRRVFSSSSFQLSTSARSLVSVLFLFSSDLFSALPRSTPGFLGKSTERWGKEARLRLP